MSDAVDEVGLRARVANGDPLAPLCIEPKDGNPDGLYVSIYSRGGQITGVEVFDGLTEQSLRFGGVVPK